MTNFSASREADWGSLQLLRKLYGALAQEFSIDLSPCNELENPEEDGAPEARAAALAWFGKADERIGVHQLRQFLQTSRLADEAALRAALAYSLHKNEYSDADRDKIDFLLVQFFSLCAPSLLEDGEVTFGFVAETLKPVLGSSDLTPFGSLSGLDDVVKKAGACHTLQALFASGAIEKGRQLKFSAANNYFEAAALVSFTRFNFLLRRCFFRTMHRDLNAILDGLRALDSRGVQSLDCRSAELSAEEPVGRLRMICQSWKAMFHAEYSYGQPLRMLTDLRAAVDAALNDNSGETASQPSAENSAPAAPVVEKPPAVEVSTGKKSKSSQRAKAAAASGKGSARDASPNDSGSGKESGQ